MSTPRTILLVDDDPVSLTLMRRVLERAGYRVLTAADGNHGLAIIERETPALVVVDLMMPLASGFQLIEKLKACERTPRIVVVTASEGDRPQAHAQRLGVDEYLRKPLNAEQLLATAQRLCPMVVEPESSAVESH